MRNLSVGFVFLATPYLLFGQLDDNTLTVAVTSTAVVQPDQALIEVYVTADVTVALDDILAAVQGAGVSATNLEYGQAFPSSADGRNVTQWGFLLPVAFAKLNGTLASLDQIAAGIAKSNPTWYVTYFIQGARLSPELQAAQPCARTALVGAAQAQAQAYAAAAGGRVGPIMGLSDGVSGGVPLPSLPSEASSAYASVSYAVLSALPASPAPPTCSMTVQFKLLR